MFYDHPIPTPKNDKPAVEAPEVPQADDQPRIARRRIDDVHTDDKVRNRPGAHDRQRLHPRRVHVHVQNDPDRLGRAHPALARQRAENRVVEVECLGACDAGPVALIDDKLYENLTPESAVKAVQNTKDDGHH